MITHTEVTTGDAYEQKIKERFKDLFTPSAFPRLGTDSRLFHKASLALYAIKTTPSTETEDGISLDFLVCVNYADSEHLFNVKAHARANDPLECMVFDGVAHIGAAEHVELHQIQPFLM